MIKFLHAADLHLDSPFHALPPEKAQARRREQRQLLDDLAELCRAEGCDLMLLAGDLFDAAAVWQDTAEALCRALGGCGAEVFIAPGNHDFCAPGSLYGSAPWPANVHIFRDPTPSSVVLEPLGAEIWGAGFRSASSPPLLEGFRVRDPEMTNLMVLHGDAENAASPYNPVTRQQIEDSGLDYLALGHIHAASGLRHAGRTAYAWPGCAMGRGFDELGDKGVYLGTLSREGCRLEFRPLPGRRYQLISVEAGDDPRSAIEAALPAGIERDICRVVLTGACPPPDTRALYAALQDRCFGLTIRDQTTPRRDLWAERGDGSLKALFLETLYDDPDRAEDPALWTLAAELGVAAMEGREAPLG